MKVIVRKWKGNVFEVIKVVHIDSYNGLAFRLPTTETATSVKVSRFKVTEMYMHASEPNTLVVYGEEVEG